MDKNKENQDVTNMSIVENEYIFAFLTAPDCPRIVEAIFPIDKSVDAFDFKNQYITLRVAKWSYGKLPSWNETKPL